MQYKIEYIYFHCVNNENVRLMVPLPEKYYSYDKSISQWFKKQSGALFITDATDDIITYLESIKISCCHIYPEIIRKEKGLVIMCAMGSLLNTAIDVKVRHSLSS